MTGKKTICIDARYLRERPSGIATIVQAIVDHVPGWAPELDFLLLKHPNAPGRLSAAPNVREVVVRQEANGPATLFFLPRLVDFDGVDLYHGPFNILPHGLEMRTVVTINDVMWLTHPQWAQSPGIWKYVETPFYQHGIKNALRHATRIIAISQATKREIEKLDPRAADRTRVVLEGVSSGFRPTGDEVGRAAIEAARTKHLGDPHRRYVLSVGQYVGYKNHDTVLRAFALAFGKDSDVHLAFVQRLGSGPEVLGPMARDLGVGGRVHFLHGVPFPELVHLFQGAMVLCHPSLVEGFGNCPSEAMMAGCPVVTSNRSSMPEVSGSAALLVDPEDPADVARALARVAGEPELAASMSARGMVRAAELTWEACARGTLDVYRETLGLPD
jgi:glycosyltransferase involved in cell wall biosynthesis